MTPDQAGTLELVVLLVLIALENLANLNQRIQTELNMNPQTAEKIADMTREKIITPVKLHLLPLQEDEVSEVSESERGQKEVNSTPKQEESLTMLDDKLNSITKLPSEETHYTDSSAQTIPKPLEQAAKPNTPGLNPSSNISPSPIVKNQNQDPYREPIN